MPQCSVYVFYEKGENYQKLMFKPNFPGNWKHISTSSDKTTGVIENHFAGSDKYLPEMVKNLKEKFQKVLDHKVIAHLKIKKSRHVVTRVEYISDKIDKVNYKPPYGWKVIKHWVNQDKITDMFVGDELKKNYFVKYLDDTFYQLKNNGKVKSYKII